jgi:SEC-C motif-containing protein
MGTQQRLAKLEVLNSIDNTVEFKAYFLDSFGKHQIHHELSTFKFENESWFYVDGTFYFASNQILVYTHDTVPFL